jgi:hypothetical protein
MLEFRDTMIGARTVEIGAHLVCKVDRLPDMIDTGSKSELFPFESQNQPTELKHY